MGSAFGAHRGAAHRSHGTTVPPRSPPRPSLGAGANPINLIGAAGGNGTPERVGRCPRGPQLSDNWRGQPSPAATLATCPGRAGGHCGTSSGVPTWMWGGNDGGSFVGRQGGGRRGVSPGCGVRGLEGGSYGVIVGLGGYLGLEGRTCDWGNASSKSLARNGGVVTTGGVACDGADRGVV